MTRLSAPIYWALFALLLFPRLVRSQEDAGAPCSAEAPCGDGSFCAFELGEAVGGTCAECEWHSHYCFAGNLTDAGVGSCFEACHSPDFCSVAISESFDGEAAAGCAGGHFCNFDLDTHGFCERCAGDVSECYSMGLPVPGAEHCEQVCDSSSNACTAETDCGDGWFCALEDGDEGSCAECDWHAHYCFESDLSMEGVDLCMKACYSPWCEDMTDSYLNVNGVDIESNGITGSIFGNATGPLVDVGLGIGDLTEYVGQDITGSVCLIKRGEISFYDKVAACKEGGGIGAIIFNNEPQEFGGFMTKDDDSAIPTVTVSGEEGEQLRSSSIGKVASINIVYYGEYCRHECSTRFPEIGMDGAAGCPENHHCNFDYDGTHGFCEECTDASHCFFSGLPLAGAEHCAETCPGSSLSFDNCKLCEDGISRDSLGTASLEDSATCDFCPGGLDPAYDDVFLPMFGGDFINCFLVDEYFRNYGISVNDKNCQIGLMYSHLCGCEGGTGYAGANTPAKRKAFVWLPRCTAIASFLVSATVCRA